MNTVTIGEGFERIELSWTRDGTGEVVGKAYFFHDDMGADIVAGCFSHPFRGTEYRMHVSSKYNDITLEVRTWRTVGHGKIS